MAREPDYFGATVAAILALSPNLKFSVSNLVDSDGNNLNEIDWDSFDVLEGSEVIPERVDILAKREELIAAAPLNVLRRYRNEKLKESDWTQNEDVPQEVRDLWKPYRQALRDITLNYTSIDDVVWPTPPE